MSKCPLSVEELDKETNDFLKEKFKGHPSGMIKMQPGEVIINAPFAENYETIYNMEIKPDDIWVLASPKAGQTWTQELVWTIYHEGDVEASNSKQMLQKWGFVEFDCINADIMAGKLQGMSDEEKLKMSFLYKAINAPSPRFIKSHLPLHMLPPTLLNTAKVIFVARNPMDVCVSWYHHCKGFNNHDWQGSFDEFFDFYIRDRLLFSPYWESVRQAWKQRTNPNMLFLFYEDMKKDVVKNIKKIAEFLGKSLNDDQIEAVRSHVDFNNMKKNPNLNMEGFKTMGILKQDAHFIRKGIVGDFKNHLTPEQEKKMEDWNRKNAQDLGIEFPGVQLWKD